MFLAPNGPFLCMGHADPSPKDASPPRTPGPLSPVQGKKNWTGVDRLTGRVCAAQGSQHPRLNTVEFDLDETALTQVCRDKCWPGEDRYIEYLWCQTVRHIPRAHRWSPPFHWNTWIADTDMPLISWCLRRLLFHSWRVISWRTHIFPPSNRQVWTRTRHQILAFALLYYPVCEDGPAVKHAEYLVSMFCVPESDTRRSRSCVQCMISKTTSEVARHFMLFQCAWNSAFDLRA
jgi:hypothetical protein